MANFANQGSRLALGGKRAAIQDFIDIDVPETSNDLLIKQGRFQGGRFFPESAGKKIGAEFIAEGFHSDIPQQPVACQFTFTEQVHDAEAAMIRVNNARSIIQGDDHMVMGTGTCVHGAGFKVKLSQIVRLRVAIQNRKAPSHAEMHQKAMAVIKVNQYILGPAMQAQNLPALQPGSKIGWKGKPETGTAKINIGNGATDKDGN